MEAYLVSRAYSLNNLIKYNLQQCELVALQWLILDSMASLLNKSAQEQSAYVNIDVFPSSDVKLNANGDPVSVIIKSDKYFNVFDEINWDDPDESISITRDGNIVTFSSSHNPSIDRFAKTQITSRLTEKQINIMQDGLREPFCAKDGNFLLNTEQPIYTLKHGIHL